MVPAARPVYIVIGPYAARFIGREIWAAFDSGTGAGYAGDYVAGTRPELPLRITAALSAP
jgi:hypothetical protein